VTEQSAGSTGFGLHRAVRNAWNTVLTIYYANSLSWRALKSGGLFAFGFFLWAGSNILLSYQPGWTVLHYTMAYGFVLIGYGPFHHLVVIPLAIRLRRQGGTRTRIGKHLPNAGLAVFLVAVLVLGTFPVGPVTASFQSVRHGSSTDVNPDVHCVEQVDAAGTTAIHCRLSNVAGVGRVVAESGGTRLATDDSSPFAFTIDAAAVESVAGQREFTILVYDEHDNLARRFTRRLSMIETAGTTSAAVRSPGRDSSLDRSRLRVVVAGFVRLEERRLAHRFEALGLEAAVLLLGADAEQALYLAESERDGAELVPLLGLAHFDSPLVVRRPAT